LKKKGKLNIGRVTTSSIVVYIYIYIYIDHICYYTISIDLTNDLQEIER